MVKAHFLIVFLIFNIPDSFCRNVLEAEESFVELGVYQKILYEYDEYEVGSENCNDLVFMNPKPEYDVRPFVNNHACQGELLSCAWSAETTTCALTVGQTKLQWVEGSPQGIHRTYGKRDSCPANKGLTMYRPHPDRSVCACDCFKTNWGIYMGQMHSRESDNYVITGIRFILRNNVLYLQPAEGRLEADRKISGFSWVSLPTDPSDIRRIDRTSANFFLDDLILDEGYALTGVKFEYMEAPNPEMVKGFGISVSGRPFFPSGDLDLRPGKILTIKPKPSTTRYSLSQMPIAILDKMGTSISKLSLENHEYVPLRQSSYESDFGQSTLPLLRNSHVGKYDELLSGFGIFLDTYMDEDFLTLRLHSRRLD